MAILDDFKPYIDQFGLTQPKAGEMSGNGLIYTAEYILALLANNVLDDTEIDRLKKVYESCEVMPGLMRRSPVGGAQWKDQEGPDDYNGCAVASYFLKSDLAAKILKYGRDNPARLLGIPIPYNYNNVEPNVLTPSSFLGRQQNLICHLQFAAGEEPPLWRKLWWCIAILIGAHATPDHCDSWIMSWLQIRVMDGRSVLCNLAASYWKKRFFKQFPTGIQEVLAKYFSPDHPLAKYIGTGF